MEQRDVIVIGGGPAGYAAAIRLAQLGTKATLIEKEALGGTCLNRGCVPTMVMAKAVEILEQARGAKDFGITLGDGAIDFEKLMGRKKMVTKIHVGGVRSLLEAYGIELIQGTGRLVSPSEMEITGIDGGQRRVTMKKTLIATGAVAAKATLPGDSGTSIDIERLLDVIDPPPSMIVVGGGPHALTLATIFSHLGTRVTVIEESERLLPEIDEEVVNMLLRELKKSKIEVVFGARSLRVAEGPDNEKALESVSNGAKINLKGACIVRTGRQANIDGLGLPEIGVKLNGQGGIMTDLFMETTAKSVFAAGDVTMNHLCTPVAYAEGITAAENMAGKGRAMSYSGVPQWSGTIPAVCGAGLTEAGARTKGYDVRVGRFPMAANGMATVLGRRVGMIKVVTDARYGQILGVHMVGHNAPELVHEVLLAMKSELTPQDVGAVFHVHPSLAEAFWDAVRAADGASINSFSPGA
jgi:dihydrolipoamide dehydrogenase